MIDELGNNNIVSTKEIQKAYQDATIDLDERFFDYMVVKSVVDHLRLRVKNGSTVVYKASDVLRLIDESFPVFKLEVRP